MACTCLTNTPAEKSLWARTSWNNGMKSASLLASSEKESAKFLSRRDVCFVSDIGELDSGRRDPWIIL